MKRKEWFLGTAVLGALFMVAWLLWPRPAISYAHLQEAWAEIQAEGFHCTADRADGTLENGFLVSREQPSFEEVCRLCKAGPMGDEWKGKVWVRTQHPRQTWTMPDDADPRLWGAVCIFGDKDFIAEIEAALQRSRSFNM